MQIKYTALFEGVAFGVMLLWLRWRMRGLSLAVVRFAIVLVATALLPTALAYASYALAGHGAAFVSANFVSIFQKQPQIGFSAARVFLVPSAVRMAPILGLAAVAAGRVLVRRRVSLPLAFTLLWSLLALVEFFAIGNFYDHYAIPLLMPLTIVVASGFEWAPFGFVVAWLTALSMIPTSGALSQARFDRDKTRTAALTRALAPYAHRGCIFIYDGPSILYLTTHSCLPTRYAFPGHLRDADEARATDAQVSMATLLKRRPSAIVMAKTPGDAPRNLATEALLLETRATDYHLTETLPDGNGRIVLIYVRNDLR